MRRCGVVGIGGEEEAGAGGADDADAAETTVERVGTGRLVEVADDDDGGAGALGRGFQRAQGMADVLIDAGTDPGGKKGDEGVEDDEGGIGLLDDGVEDGEVAGEGEGAAGLGAIGDGDEDDDALGIAAGGIDAGADGVEDVVLGGEEEDAARGSRFRVAAGEGIAAGDAGGELAEEGALAETGVTIEDGDLASGDAAGPEPAQGFGGDIAEAGRVTERLSVGPHRDAGFTALTP